MTREDVRKILPEISDEQLNGIMNLHGADITSYKDKILGLENEIKAKQEAVEKAEGQSAALSGEELERLKAEEFNRGRAEAGAEFEKYKFEQALNRELIKSGAKNADVLKALLNLDGIKAENGQLEGLSEQIEKIRSDFGYLFESDGEDAKPQFTSDIGGGTFDISSDAFGKMGYKERLNLFKTNPELYNELRQR